MRKIIAALAVIIGIASPIATMSVEAQASTINDSAKQNRYGGVSYLYQILQQEGIPYNNFYAENPLNYRNGKPEGVVIHETATPGATAHAEAIYFNREWKNTYTYVHAFVDKLGVIQMMTPDYGVWGAGPMANNRFVQVELCQDNNLADFAKSINNDAIYVAQILRRYNLTPDNAVHDGKGTVWSHHAVSQFLGGTDHTDPDGYFAKWGYSMDDFFDLITYYYNQQLPSSTDNSDNNDNPTVTKPVLPAKPTAPVTKPVTKPIANTLPKPQGTKILMHNARVYDENGLATEAPTKKAGTELTIYGEKTIKQREYIQIGLHQYIVANNINGKMQRLSHNAFIYDKNGVRIGNSKLYGSNYVRTYGGRVKIKGHKYYIINQGQYVKDGNFK